MNSKLQLALAIFSLLLGLGLLFFWPDTPASATSPGGANPTTAAGQAAAALKSAQTDAAHGTKLARPTSATLRGSVDTPVGSEFPLQWSLIVEPSRTLPKRAAAATRKLDFFQGERDFEVADLPFADYDVRPLAAAFQAQRLAIALDATNASPYVLLQLTPAGFLDGRVLDEQGELVPELEVQLVRRSDGLLLSATTDGAGAYRFAELLDDDYSLVPVACFEPLGSKIELSFTAPSLRVPDIRLPPLATLVVSTRDQNQFPVQNVPLTITTPKRKILQAITGPTGAVELRHLQPGRYGVAADGASFGKANLDVYLNAGQRTEHLLVLVP